MKGHPADCKARKATWFRNKQGKLISYGKCVIDNKSCKEYDQYGSECYVRRDRED
jgi:hypothetical protein